MDRIGSLLIAAAIFALAVAVMNRESQPAETAPVETTAQTNVAAPSPRAYTSRAAYISREEDGHYWTSADVNGTAVDFLVDTGASIVALTWRDAKRLRLDPDALDFEWSIRTANGETKGAFVKLESIRIGNVKIEEVDAMVLPEDALHDSLLGMSFLGELSSYEFRGNTLIIRK